MPIVEKYQYGQGRILLAPWTTTIDPSSYQWIGDADSFSMKPTSDKVQHKESFSGQRGLVRNFPVGPALDITIKGYQFDAAAIARVMRGKVSNQALGTVTAEALPDALTVGAEVYLANPFVSSVVITDATTVSPKTLLEGTDYIVDANFGRVSLLNVTGYTQPFAVAYSYAARNTVGILTQGQQLFALRYEEVNLAEGNEPRIVLVHKLAPDLVDELDFISSGNDVSGMSLTGSALLDSSKPATGDLGQFAAIIEPAPVA
jgi:hypothetical protein